MTQRTKLVGVRGLLAHSGQDLGTSEWKEMRYEDIERFAAATGDRQWIHVDRERIAIESPYGVPVAHGYFTLSLIATLFFEIVDIDEIGSVVNYGTNRVRFPAPLRAGDHYRLSVKLAEVNEVRGGAEALMHASIDLKGQPKPACAAEILYRFLV